MMLPHVVRFNGDHPATRAAYVELALAAGIPSAGDAPNDALQALVAQLENALRLAALPHSLEECGIQKSAIPMLAGEAAGQWTANFNPRPVSRDDFVALYSAASALGADPRGTSSRDPASNRPVPKKKGAAVQRPR